METTHDIRLFRWLLLVGLGLLYVLNVAEPRSGRGSVTIVALGLLVLVHAGAHWHAMPLLRGRWRWAYMLGQGALMIGITLLTGEIIVAIGLYLALTAEAVILLDQTVQVAQSVGTYFVLFLGATGLNFPLVLAASFLVDLAFITMFVRQKHARQRAQEFARELAAAHQQLEVAHQALAAYATQVEDLTRVAERQRIARELHDTLAQGLVGVIMQLEAINAHLIQERIARAQEITAQAMKRARTTLMEAREAIDDLRTESIPSFELSAAVAESVHRFQDACGIPCEMDLAPLTALPIHWQEQALRMVTEGLTNIARHARAQRAWVQAMHRGSTLVLEVGDDGVGFDPAVVGVRQGHYGLRGLQERAALVGGALEVISAPGAGTRLQLRLPCSGIAEAA